MAKYRGPEVRISKGRLLRNFCKSLTGPLRPPSVAHISCSGFWCVIVKLPVRIFSFLLPQAGSDSLNVLYVSVAVVLAASITKVLGQVCTTPSHSIVVT